MHNKVSIGGMLLAAAMIFSYLEHLIPFEFIAPGVKLGLANCVFLLSLICLGAKTAFSINILRILLTVLLFGSPVTLIFSLSGAIFSGVITVLLFKSKLLSLSGIGAVSGVAHNIAQLAAAMLVTGSTGVFWYFPVLLISGAVCGFATGVAADKISPRINKFLK